MLAVGPAAEDALGELLAGVAAAAAVGGKAMMMSQQPAMKSHHVRKSWHRMIKTTGPRIKTAHLQILLVMRKMKRIMMVCLHGKRCCVCLADRLPLETLHTTPWSLVERDMTNIGAIVATWERLNGWKSL